MSDSYLPVLKPPLAVAMFASSAKKKFCQMREGCYLNEGSFKSEMEFISK